MDFNADGQHHADCYIAPKYDFTPLYYPNGEWTGQGVTKAQLHYDDGIGQDQRLRLDYHEKISSPLGYLYFHRGGKGYVGPEGVKYGHVRLGDLKVNPGTATPSGENRGAYPGYEYLGGLYELHVTALPLEMHYKANSPGSKWATYGDPGSKYGDPFHYTFLLWSFLNVGGGGMVRGLISDFKEIRLLNVPKVKMPSYALDGSRNGSVWGAYVRVYGLCGWIVWAHEYLDSGFVPHVKAL